MGHRRRTDAERKAMFRRIKGSINRKKKRKTRSILCIDTETTGLANKDRIIQFAGVLKSGDEYLTYDTKVKPPCKISYTAYKIHGISWKDVKDSPRFYEVRPEIAGLIRAVDVVVVQNGNFDCRMLKNQGVRVPEKKLVDTMYLAKEKGLECSGNGRVSLDSITHQLDIRIPSEYRHSASADAIGTIKAYELLERMPSIQK